MPTDPLFIDTSIQIAQKVHRTEIQQAIAARLRQYRDVRSGLIVRQEVKRRLLKEALYLLKQLSERKSFERVMRHVADSLPPAHARKKQINLQLLMTIDEADSDEDRFDRARLMLRDLIKNGIATSEAHLTLVNQDSGCACALQPITEKRPFLQYDFGSDRCSRTGGRCRVRQFLENHKDVLQRIHDYLAAMPDDGTKTAELTRAENFIQTFLQRPDDVEQEDPCLTVGDLKLLSELEKDRSESAKTAGKSGSSLD